MLTSLAIALLGSPALMATDAAASPGVWEARPLALEMHAGFGTPVGLFGGIVEYSLSPLLGIGAGLGIGVESFTGSTQHAALVGRLRPARGKNIALEIGVAYSIADQYQRPAPFARTEYPEISSVDGLAHWAQVEFGFE